MSQAQLSLAIHPRRACAPLLLGLLVAACGASLTACGARQVRSEGPSEVVMVLDPTFVLGQGEEARIVGPRELFREANKALSEGSFNLCARYFDQLWQNLDAMEIVGPALYNAGLCHERMEAWSQATERYERLIALNPASRDGLDALFRLAEVSANAGQWPLVVTRMQEALLREDLRHLDVMEAHYRLGMAQLATGAFAEAETTFSEGLRRNRVAGSGRLPGGNYFVSGCHYGIALSYHLLFAEIRFRLPESAMQAAMRDKKQLARQANSHYVRTIHQKNHYWSILSGYMVGKLFEDFYYDIISAEIPRDLSEEEVDAYFSSLREELRPLLEQALAAYEKTSAVSERIGFRNDWVKVTDERMQRLRAYMDDEQEQRSEEERIREWNRQLRELDEAREAAPTHGTLLVEPPPPPMPVAKAAAPE